MNRWFDEYEFFSKTQFQHFLQRHNITNLAQLTPAHPAWQEVQNQLQQIENQWAATTNKTPAQVVLTPAQATEKRFLKLLGRSVNLQDAEHQYIDNVHHIPWNPTTIEMHPFELVLSMRHESEHGSQSAGAGYSTNEHTLIWIERACSAATKDYYWVRLSEMNARMKEAEWCTEMMSTHKGHTSVEDRTAILQMATSLLSKLWDIRLKEDMLSINTIQQKMLKKKDVDRDLLQLAFPDTKERDLCYKASQFMHQEASKVYREHFIRLKAVYDQLTKDVEKWQQELPTEQKQCAQKQENQKIDEIAQQYGLPVLTNMPDGVISVLIKTTYAAASLQNLTDKHYSPAIVIFSNQPAQLVYDNAPIPRSYSISPALRMQWQSENEAPNDASVGAPEYDSHDEMDDL